MTAAGPLYLGVDIGGTFTDLVMVDSAGRISTSKALTTPGELETGVLNAIGNAVDGTYVAETGARRQGTFALI